MTIQFVSQRILLSGFGGRKTPSSMGKIRTAEVPSATLRTGSSTPRNKRCLTRSICEALRSEAVTLLIFRAKSSSFKRICHPDRSAAQWRDLLFPSAHPI